MARWVYEKIDNQYLYIRVPALQFPANKTLNIELSPSAAFICKAYQDNGAINTGCNSTSWNLIFSQVSKNTPVCASISVSENGKVSGIKIFFNTACVPVARLAS